MRILDRSVYVGPSIYALFPVIRLELDLGILEEWPTRRLGPAFTSGLLEGLPGLHEHGCSYGEPGGFVRRLGEDEGTWLGHVLEHVAIELQVIAGQQVTFGKTRAGEGHGVYTIVFEYEDPDVGLAAARLGLRLLQSLLPDDLRRQVRLPPTSRSTGPPSGTGSSAPPSGAPSAPAPCRWSAPRRSATSPGSGSTPRA